MRGYLPQFTGRVSVVTGAGHGIGEGIARLLAEQGSSVYVVDRMSKQAQRVAKSIGGLSRAVECDIGRHSDVDRLLKTVLAAEQRVDILVNNAFHWDGRRLEAQDWAGLRKYAQVNFTGTVYLTERVLKHMREAGAGGSVVCITSVHQTNVRRLHPWYSYGKAGLAMMVKEWAVAYGPWGIRVNAMAPGHIETDDAKVTAGERTDNQHIPLRAKSGLPEDVAKAVLFLASDDTAGFISGTTLFVDGGESLWGGWAHVMPPAIVGP